MCLLLPAPHDTARQHQYKSLTWDSSVRAHPCDRRKSVSPDLMRGRVRYDRPVLLGSLVAKPHCTMDQHPRMSPASQESPSTRSLRQRLRCTKRCANAARSQTVRVHPSVSGSRGVRRRGADPTTRKRRVVQRANGRSCSQHDSLSWLQTLRRAQAEHVFVEDMLMFCHRDGGNVLTSSR